MPVKLGLTMQIVRPKRRLVSRLVNGNNWVSNCPRHQAPVLKVLRNHCYAIPFAPPLSGIWPWTGTLKRSHAEAHTAPEHDGNGRRPEATMRVQVLTRCQKKAGRIRYDLDLEQLPPSNRIFYRVMIRVKDTLYTTLALSQVVDLK